MNADGPHTSSAYRDAKYNELILAVERKFPGESRHETALRYIREAESRCETDGTHNVREQLAIARRENEGMLRELQHLRNLARNIEAAGKQLERPQMVDVALEMVAQDAKWGSQQHHSDSMWLTILTEEVGEAAKDMLEGRSPRGELVQVAAVVLQWIGGIDHRDNTKEQTRD